MQATFMVYLSLYLRSLQPSPRGLALALDHSSIPLGPILHGLTLNLSASQLRNLVDKNDTAHQPLVLGDSLSNPALDVFRSHLAL